MKHTRQPGIDWQEYKTRYASNLTLGQEILETFVESLDQQTIDIIQLHNKQNYQAVLTHIHSLHGAACYACVPELKQLLHNIESNLKKMCYQSIGTLLEDLPQHITSIHHSYKQHTMTSHNE